MRRALCAGNEPPVEYSVMTPAVVIFPTLPAKNSPNHKFPSGPLVIPSGLLDAAGMWYRVNVICAGLITAAAAISVMGNR
jgi:hypothetical protein